MTAMRLSTQADYAVRAVYELSLREPGAVVQTRDIAAAQDLPEGYLAKVIQSLVRAGLMRSSRGTGGGVSLARPRNEINVREVFEAVDGPLELHRCAAAQQPCEPGPCGTHSFWQRIEDVLTAELERTDFEALALCRPGAETGDAVAARPAGR